MQTLEEIIGKWSSGDVTANNLRLHYTRTGGEKPPLVLAHGFSDDGLCWTPVAQALEADFDVVMIDARGHGNSEAPEQGYGSVEMAHDLAGVIKELRLDSPIVLGHSMGAATALTLAGLYPQLPGAILLEDPPAWWKTAPPAETTGDAPVDDSWQQRMRSWIIELQSQSREELIEKQQRAAPSWSPIEVEMWADAHLRLSLNVLNGSRPPRRPRLEPLRAHLLPRIAPYRRSRARRDCNPGRCSAPAGVDSSPQGVSHRQRWPQHSP